MDLRKSHNVKLKKKSYVKIDGSNDELSTEEDVLQEESTETNQEEPVVRQSTRDWRCPDYYREWANVADNFNEPSTVEEALSSPDREKWKVAMNTEFECLSSNKVWELVPLPKNGKVIRSLSVKLGNMD